ncbi:MAG TPA: hypothetical protein VJK51_01120 [Candidatus Nanoarchaeia archaeon]|nr:hypothetical protein [Candidatus Nanoarchaeia archaeon]
MSYVPKNIGYQEALLNATTDLNAAKSIDPTISGDDYRDQLYHLKMARNYASAGLKDTTAPEEVVSDLQRILNQSGEIQRSTIGKIREMVVGVLA